jgi:sugar lactone lactonase YvrE
MIFWRCAQQSSSLVRLVSTRSRSCLSSIVSLLAFLLLFAGAACSPAASQTASFSYAQVALGSGWSGPGATAVDAYGNVYVADTANHAVKQIAAVSGAIPASPTIVTLSASFQSPAALALDSLGNLYVAEMGNGAINNGSIKEIVATSPGVFPATPTIVTLASGYTRPAGIAVDADGNVFFTQQVAGAAAVNEIEATSVGVFPATPTITAIGTANAWTDPAGVAVDQAGNVYIAGNQSPAVSEILKAGVYATVKTLASAFTTPEGLAVDASGNVFVADAAGTVSEIEAVNGSVPASPTIVSLGNGWSSPTGISVDGLGNIFVADTQAANGVQEIMTSLVSFGAANVGSPSSNVALTFTFASGGTIQPPAVLTQGTAGLDFADKLSGSCSANGSNSTWTANSTCTVMATLTPSHAGLEAGAVELLDSNGNVIATAFVSGIGIGSVAGYEPASMGVLTVTGLGQTALAGPGGPAFDGLGNLYVADSVNSRVLEVAAPASGSAAATVIAAGVSAATAVALDGAGNLYMAAGGNSVMKYTPSGLLSTLDNNGLSYANGSVAVDAAGNVFTADTNNSRIVWFPAGGPASVFYAGGPLNSPGGIAVDAQGNVYVANSGGNNIVKIAQGTASILSATYRFNSTDSNYSNPTALALDSAGNLYICDTGNGRMVLIPAGTGSAVALQTGPNAFTQPVGVAVSNTGTLAVIDGASNSIFTGSVQSAPSLAFPNTAVSATSASQTVTLMNLGNSPLSFTVPGTGNNPSLSGNFLQNATTCPSVNAAGTAQSLAASSACTFDLAFNPQATGVVSGSLVLMGNAVNGATQTVSLNGTGIAPSITLTPAAGTLTDGVIGAAFSQQFTAGGGTAPYTYTMLVTSGSLPTGMAFNASTGLLSGTPTVGGTFSFTVAATDSSSAPNGGPFTSSAQAYSLTIASSTIAIAPASLSAGTAGSAYGNGTFSASGGSGPYSFAIISGSLPPGLQLSNGVLTGTPTAVGTFYFTISATDSVAKIGNKDYAMVVGAPNLSLTPARQAMSDGTAESAYTQQFTAGGGTAPYTYTVSNGALPAGMNLSAAGLLTGKPTTAGSYSFTVQAADSTTGSGAPYVVSRTYSFNLYAPIVSVIPMDGLLASGTVGQTNYSLAYSAKGGNGTYTFSETAGALPTGMHLTGGVLSGTPTATGTFTFTVTATDGEMFTGNKTYSLTIGSPTIAIAPANAVLGEGSAEIAYSAVTFTASSNNGGTAPYAYAVTAGSLPAGLALNAAGVLSGTPTAAGTFYFTVNATDANGQTGSREFELSIAAPLVTLAANLLPDASVGNPYSQTVLASGGSGSYTYTASGLPAWLTLDPSGLLHGTPAATDIGVSEVAITAIDADGFQGSLTFTPSVYGVAAAASGAQDFGTVTMGAAPANATVTFSFNGTFTLGATPVVVVTQGASSLDFSNAGSGSCAQGTFGVTSQSCTVNVAFNPQAPGLRLGAVELLDGNGNVIATQYVFGNGKGAEANFLPGSESTVSSNMPLTTPQGMAVDAAGSLYVADSGSNQVLQIKQGTAQAVMTSSGGLGTPRSVAVDGAGNVYIADSANNTIWKVGPSFGTAVVVTSATINSPSGGLSGPRGVAVDGAGNIYIADTGNGRILVTSPSADGGYLTPWQLSTSTALTAPYAVAVDRGSVYIADFSGNFVLIEPAGGTENALGNEGAEIKISAGVSAPTGVAVDVNKNVYIANSGTANVLKVTKGKDCYGLPAAVATVATLNSPQGVAVDGSGDVFIADSTHVYEENYTAPPTALTFATPTAQGSLDVADGALGFTMLNFGNADLNFTSSTAITDATGSFAYDASRDCYAQGNGLSANSSCIFELDFTPSQTGTLNASLELSYNNLGAASATQTIALSGTGVASFVFTPASGSALVAGVVDTAYSQTITASGGSGPYSYAITQGTLPTGLTLSAAGVLAGTPASSGVFEFTVTATDSNKVDGSAHYSLTIAPAATALSSTQDTTNPPTVTFTFTSAATVGSVAVLTQGVTGQDFTNAGTGTCAAQAYAANATCTVIVAFTAKYPGTRYGAVELLDASGNILATQDISAVGTAPLALFSPGIVGSLSLSDVSGLGATPALNLPSGLALDPSGNVYVADTLNDRVVKVDGSGTATVVTTLGITLHYPTGVALDGAGNLYIADDGDGQVVMVTAAGVASVLDNGALKITNNFSVAVDGSGNVYTTDLGDTNTNTPARIVEYPGGGTAQVVAITGGPLSTPTGLAIDGAGNLWIADNNNLFKVSSGAATAFAAGNLSPALAAPLSIAVDGMGNLYVADGGNRRVLEIPVGAGDLSSAFALNLASSTLNYPFGVAISATGDLYVADATANSVLVSNQEKAPTFAFDSAVGASSSAASVTLMNVGNSALTIAVPASAGSNPGFAGNPSSFALNSTYTTCPQIQFGGTAGTVAAGQTCIYAVDFTPTAAGLVTDTLTLTDNSNNVSGATQTLALAGSTVAVSPGGGTPSTPYGLPTETVGVIYNANLAATFSAAGGNAPYSFSVSAGSLPNGMQLSQNGVLYGTPTAVGNYAFTVAATDSNGQAGSQAYSLAVHASSISLNPTTLMTSGMVDAAYSQTFSATGGTFPYTFAVTAGSLPQGLTLSRGGELTGTPTATASPASFAITATDVNGQAGSRTYSLTVNQPPIALAPASGSPTALPGGTAMVVYGQSFSARGGTAPYSYALTVNSGSLPAGLALDAQTGILSGTPASGGIVSFTIAATDSSSKGPFTGSQTYTLAIAPPSISMLPEALPDGAVGGSYVQALAGRGGGAPYTFSITGGNLPAGLTLNGDSLTGTPTEAGLDSFTLSATDTVSGAIGSQTYTPTIYAAQATAAPSAFATPQSVGTTSASPNTVTFTFHGSAIVGGWAVLTEGAANLDFADAHSGTCTITEYNDGDTCTLAVDFAPLYPGQRNGALELLDANGNILGTALLTGTGLGPVANILPATESTLASAVSNPIALQSPQGLAVDASGNVLIADSSAHAVLSLTPAGNIAKLLDLSASSGTPTAVAIDGAGNVYAADSANNAVWKIAPPYTGAPSVVTSKTVNPPSGGLASPSGVAVDASGNVYVASSNNIYELVQSPILGYAAPVQIPTYSQLSGPTGLAVDASGNIYIADSLNHRVLIEPAGGSTVAAQETIVGGAPMNAPAGIAVDVNGNLYVADLGSATVLKVVKTGAGYATPSTVTTRSLQSAFGVAVDGAGNLYLSDATGKTVIEENYAAPPRQQFAKATTIGATDTTDGPAVFTLLNSGNAPLTAAAPGLAAPNDFQQTPGTGSLADCTAAFSLQANAGCSISILFKPLSAGSLTESFVLTDNSITSAVQFIPLQGTGLIPLNVTWAAPVAIPYGTPLSATQLNASAGAVDGTFVYTPNAGTVLSAGAQTLSVTFTPTDAKDYSAVTMTVPLQVNQAASAITVGTSINPGMSQNPITFTAIVTATAGAPTGSVNFLDGTTVLGSGTVSGGVATFTTSALATGTHTISAVYSGDTNFISSASSALTQAVINFSITPNTSGSVSGDTQTMASGGQATFSLAIAPTTGVSFPLPTTLTVTGLPSGATATLTTAGWVQQSDTSWTLPANTTLTDLTLNIQWNVIAANHHEQPIGMASHLAPLLLGLLVLPFSARFRRAGRRLGRKASTLLLVIALAAASVGMSGCLHFTLTPQTFNYNVTVKAGGLSHATTLKLVVE